MAHNLPVDRAATDGKPAMLREQAEPLVMPVLQVGDASDAEFGVMKHLAGQRQVCVSKKAAVAAVAVLAFVGLAAVACARSLGAAWGGASTEAKPASLELYDYGATVMGAKRVLLTGYSDARCLDGSPGAYYYRKASDEKKRRSWVIFLEGGGSCVENSACSARAQSHLGSSKSYPAKLEFMPSLVSSYPAENPALAGWNHVFIRYCSGDLHLGQMQPADEPHWGWARFAGHRTVDRTLDDLIAFHGLGEADEVVWTGQSAGGIGSFAHLDHVADRLPNASVVGAPIAGYYWDNATPYLGKCQQPYVPFDRDGFKILHGLWKAFVPRRCAEGPHKDDPWVCAMADFSFPTLVTPAFFFEAQTDHVQLRLHSGVRCDSRLPGYLKQAEYCLQWSRNMSAHLQKVVDRAQANPKRAGIFSPACRMHIEFSNAMPLIGFMSYATALAKWMSLSAGDSAVVLFDDCCSGSYLTFNPTCPVLPIIFAH